ncbi:MAG: YihY/virulence factor BrkB family protein [Chloroflexi bacterium]|nr:YihY/virulence factor BrkB family protein [Chloroflexota bacterium]
MRPPFGASYAPGLRGAAVSVGGVDLAATGKKFLHEFREDDLSGLAAELAYRFFLALFPFLLFLAALGGFIARAAGVDNPSGRFITIFGDALPPDAASVIRTQVDQVVNSTNGGLISISILGAFWAAAGGVGALMKAINRAYNIPESRPFWKKTAIALAVTLLGGIAILGAVAAMFATQLYARDIADSLGLGAAFAVTLQVARFPILLVVMMTAVALIYWIAPNTGMPFKWVTPGAVAFALAWSVATALFAVYVTNFSSYNGTYGTLGGVVVLLLWFYITSAVMLAGAELNAVLDEEKLGPALAERRDLVAREMEEAGQPPAAGEKEPSCGSDIERPARPMPRHLTSPFVALAGIVVAAIAWRKFAH